jgi:hypothetical protein
MTPKEKAIELLEKMSFGKSYKNIGSGWSANLPNNEYYILCSLIAVDEIIQEIYSIDHQHRAVYNPETGYYSYSDSKELLFWKEVKKEIKAL